MDIDIKALRTNVEKATEFFAKKLAYTLGPIELIEMLKRSNTKLIDVRSKEDFDKGHIPGSISIPKSELKDRLSELSKEDINIVYCYNQQCHLASWAALTLAEHGYPTMELEGGFKVWTEDFGLKVES